jgi:hypothetical protein
MFALYQRGYSRQHERDADARGVRYMKAAGYNPIAAITALKKLGMERYRGINKWFATHPDVPERIQRIGEMLGVDPNTLQPLPKSGSANLEGLPSRPTALLFVQDGALYCLAPKASTPERLWQLKGRVVERAQASPDGRQVWLLVRDGKSALVHLARWQQGQATRFLTSLYADVVSHFARSPDGQRLAVLAQEKGHTFVKVFDANGRELPVTGRTPMGTPLAGTWADDGTLLLLTERFGTVTLVTITPGNAVRLTEVMGLTPSPTQFAFGPPLWVLTGNALSQVRLDGSGRKRNLSCKASSLSPCGASPSLSCGMVTFGSVNGTDGNGKAQRCWTNGQASFPTWHGRRMDNGWLTLIGRVRKNRRNFGWHTCRRDDFGKWRSTPVPRLSPIDAFSLTEGVDSHATTGWGWTDVADESGLVRFGHGVDGAFGRRSAFVLPTAGATLASRAGSRHFTTTSAPFGKQTPLPAHARRDSLCPPPSGHRPRR